MTWRWEKELQCQTEMVWVFGNREKVNETRTGWTMSKGSTPRMRLETLTGPWAWQRAVEKQRGVKLLTQGQMKGSGGLNIRTKKKKKSPFRFSLIYRSHLILSLWSCLHPSFPFLFHSGRTGIYLKFSLPQETPSKPKLHIQTHSQFIKHFRGQCCSRWEFLV